MKINKLRWPFFIIVILILFSCKNEFEISDIKGSVTDIDGNTYQTVTIGKQTWLIENLRTTRFNNGDLINSKYFGDITIITNENIPAKRDTIGVRYSGDTLTVYKSKDKNFRFIKDTLFAKKDTLILSYKVDTIFIKNKVSTIKFKRESTNIVATVDSIWRKAKTSAQCTYMNTVNNDSITMLGRLYNYYTIKDRRNIAPKGWHVATEADWTILYNYISAGSTDPTGKSMASKSNWKISNEKNSVGNKLDKNNSSSFNAFPAGIRQPNGVFSGINEYSGWWSISDIFAIRYLIFNYYDLNRTTYDKNNGVSVRCIKDAE